MGNRETRRRAIAPMTLGVLVVVVLLAVAVPASAATLFVANENSSTLSAFSIGSNGALAAVPGSPFGTASGPEGVAVTPDGRYLYVGNTGSGVVSAYAVGSTGALTPIGSFTAGTNPNGVAVTPDGRFLYVADFGSSTVSAFSIGANGALAPVPGSPFAAGSDPSVPAVTPNGRFLYVSNGGDSTVSAYAIDSGGALSPVGTFSTGSGPAGMEVTPNGRFLYTADVRATTVSAFSIGSGGALAPVPGSPFTAGPNPSGVAITPGGQLMYVSNAGGSDVVAFTINPDGTLTDLGSFGVGSSPGGGSVTSDGRFLYVPDNVSNDLAAFSIGSNGALAGVPGSPVATNGSNPFSVAATPDQGPVAKFSARAATAGAPSTFNGSGSRDPDGAIAHYDWNFGDGTSAANAGPMPTHTYAKPGSYTVRLTITDDEGCSTHQTFTGQTVSCNGSPAARITHKLTVPAPPLQVHLRSVKVSGSRATLQLSCSGSAGEMCSGSIAFTEAQPVPAEHKPKGRITRATKPAHGKKPVHGSVTVAKSKFKLDSGGSATVAVNLNATGLRLLRKSYRLRTDLSIAGTASLSRKVTFAYRRVRSPVTWTWSYKGSHTTIEQLQVARIPRGGRVTVLCHGSGCRSDRQTFRAKRHQTGIDLAPSITKRKTLKAGTKLRITVSSRYMVAKVLLIRIRRNNYPHVTKACQPPGSSHPVACA